MNTTNGIIADTIEIMTGIMVMTGVTAENNKMNAASLLIERLSSQRKKWWYSGRLGNFYF
jgi:hypothetical protein